MPSGSSVADCSAPFEIASRPGRDLERDGEHRFAVGLVPAGEGPPGVGRFELGRGDDVLHAFLVPKRAPVEAAQLVVQHAGELALEDTRSWRNLVRRREGDPLPLVVEGDVEIERLRSVRQSQPGGRDLELHGVADDRAGRTDYLELDPLPAQKRRRLQVGRDGELVARRADVAGKSEVRFVGVRSHGDRRLAGCGL